VAIFLPIERKSGRLTLRADLGRPRAAARLDLTGDVLQCSVAAAVDAAGQLAHVRVEGHMLNAFTLEVLLVEGLQWRAVEAPLLAQTLAVVALRLLDATLLLPDDGVNRVFAAAHDCGQRGQAGVSAGYLS